MASAALDTPEPYGWLSPRISFSLDLTDLPSPPSDPHPTAPDLDFEFHPQPQPHSLLLSADELISDGKLLPILLPPPPPPPPHPEPLAASPKAPRCSARLRELLRLRRSPKPSPPPIPVDTLIRKPTKSSNSISTSGELSSVPLLSESDPRPSHSSSSSDDLPRLSIDADRMKPTRPRVPLRPPLPDHPPVRVGRSAARVGSVRGLSVDSPRVNPSGRVVFHSLERSSSSPSSFNGLPRPKPRTIERSYSANVRVAPVLNVFGFAPLFSSTRKVSSAVRSRRRNGEVV